MTDELQERDPLGSELVRISLAAWPLLPNLVSDYLGPTEWLRVSTLEPASLGALLPRARKLARDADRAGDGYLDLVQRLLACTFEAPDPDELDALGREVGQLATGLGYSGPDAVVRWEERGLLRGEAKWDVAVAAYVAGRRYALDVFPVPFEERLDIGRTDDPITSLHLTWRDPDRMVFEVNVGVPRTAATTRYEVAHNI